MEVVFPRCCGLDVHKKNVVACIWIRETNGKTQKQIRTFSTMTGDLLVLHDWLASFGITHVAMESTGVFWKPVYAILEDSFTILLVNAAHIKAVPGRKTDVRDCEWIADLLAHGLLKGSFIPPDSIRDLRDLTRYRKSLIDERAREVNRLHKLLESANIKLTAVATDVMGVSAQAMLAALLEGTNDPDVLANLARGKLRSKLPELKQALLGRFRTHHRVMLGAILTHIEFLDAAIDDITTEVAVRTLPFTKEIELLDGIPGIDRRTAEVVISEIGLDMGRFPSDRHLASWAGLCPGNNESAGKRKSGKTRKGNIWLRRGLIQAAQSCIRTDTYLGAQYHRLVPRRGKHKAVTAVAHSILVIIYHVLNDKVPYRELGPDHFSRISRTHVERHHIKRLESLGYKVHLEPLEVAA